MNQNNTQPNKVINLEVRRDGEIDYDYMPVPPTVLEQAQARLSHYIGEIAIDLKARVFDYRHGTEFASIRRGLLLEKKKARFADSIGLVAVKR